MYFLLLSRDERRAIDWIGHRYAHGDDLYHLLWRDCDALPDDADWDAGCDITFRIPEAIAWRIRDIIDADGLVCLSDDFCDKLMTFRDSIL